MVLVFHKGSNKIQRVIDKKDEKKKKTSAFPLKQPSYKSPDKEPIRNDDWFDCSNYTDTKTWKNNRKACKCWMRHVKRVSQSPRALILSGRCEY